MYLMAPRSNLAGNRFDGELVDLSELSTLLVLNVSNSGLSGPFPASLASLPLLSSLDLTGYRMNDSLPAFHPSDFPLLSSLSLAGTGLTSVESLCPLHVSILDLSSNNISVVDHCISGMASLNSLDLSHNAVAQLDQLPVALLELRLANTSIRSIPNAVGVLSYRLDFSSSTIVDGVSPLQHLDMSDNPLLELSRSTLAWYFPAMNGSWIFFGRLVPTSSFFLLETLGLSHTGSFLIPPQGLPDSLNALLASGSGHLDLSDLVREQYLDVQDSAPIFFLDGNYQCASLALSHSSASIVQFDPLQYDFDYCRCMPEYFGAVPTRANPAVSHCRRCVDVTFHGSGDGVRCNVSTSVLGTEEGFFPQWSDYSPESVAMSRNGAALALVLPCPNTEACTPRGGECEYASITGQLECDGSSPADDWWMCAEGYFDRLCSQCEDGFFRSGALECDSCESLLLADVSDSNWLLLPVAVLIAAAVVLFVVLQGFGLFALVAEAAVVGLLVFVAVGEGGLLTVMLLLLLLYTVVEAEAAEALVKSLLFFLQTLAVLSPPRSLSLASLLPLPAVNLHPVGVDCATIFKSIEQPEWRTLMMLLLPVALVVLSALVVVAGFFFKRVPFVRRAIAWWDGLRARVLRPRAVVRAISAQLGMDAEVHRLLDIEDDRKEDSELPVEQPVGRGGVAESVWADVLTQVVQTGLFILYAVYFDVADAVLQVFASCDPYDAEFMAPPFSWVRCWSFSSPTQLAAEGVVGLVVYVVGVPVLFAALLARGGRVGRHAAARWFGFLFEGYRDGISYYYELAYMARRLALAAVIALVPEQSLLQPQLVSVVLFGSIVAQVVVQPYSRAGG